MKPGTGFRVRPAEPGEPAPGLARRARNAAGLGTLLGGSLAMVSYLVAGLLPLAPWGRGLLALTPFVWVAGKGALGHHVLADLSGIALEPTRLESALHRLSTVVVTASCLGVLVFALERLWGKSVPWQVYASLAFTVAMPVVVWRFLRTAEELILGIFLMYQAVLLLSGRPSQLGQVIHIPVVAAVAMLVGAWQYHDFILDRRRAAGSSESG